MLKAALLFWCQRGCRWVVRLQEGTEFTGRYAQCCVSPQTNDSLSLSFSRFCVWLYFSVFFPKVADVIHRHTACPPLRLAWKNKLHNLCLIEYLTMAFSHFGFHCLICFYEACHIVYDASLLNSGFTLKHFFMELTKLSDLCLCHLCQLRCRSGFQQRNS